MTAEQERTTYFITAKEFPVAVGMKDVTYAEALTVATNCMADGQLLCGPDDEPDGYVIVFDRVAGVRVTAKQPTGPVMVMPAALVKELAVEHEDTELTPDDGGARG